MHGGGCKELDSGGERGGWGGDLHLHILTVGRASYPGVTYYGLPHTVVEKLLPDRHVVRFHSPEA